MPLIASRRIVWQVAAGVVDGPDPDQEPDIIPAQGEVFFDAAVSYAPVPDAVPNPVTLLFTTFRGIFDSAGYLCTPDPFDPTKPGYRGVRVFVNDDPSLSVTGWTLTVRPRFAVVNGSTPSIPAFSMSVMHSTDDLDLTNVVKVPSSPGVGIEQAFALVDRAEAAAAQAALDAAVAQQVRADVDAGLFDGDTLTMGTVTPVPAGGTPTATITGTSPNKVLDLGLVKGEPGGWVITTLTGGVDFNTLVVPGIYAFGSAVLTNPGTINAPPTSRAGTVEVLLSAGASYVTHRVETLSGAGRLIIQRVKDGTNWSTWCTFTSTRTDQTAGRAIYQWDDINNREQLIYGDTGWRDITSLCNPAVLTAGGLRVRRKEYDLYIQILGGTVIASDDIVAVLPDRFRPDLASRVLALVGTVPAYGRFTGSGSNMRLPVGAYPEAVYLQPIPLTTAWPTTLPGTAVGTIPNT